MRRRGALGALVLVLGTLAPTTASATPTDPPPGRIAVLPVRPPGAPEPAAAGATTPHLDYYGGPVLADVRLTQVVYGPGAYLPETTRDERPSVAAFLAALLPSDYVRSLAEYDTTVVPVGGGTGMQQRIGAGTFLGRTTIAPAPARNGAAITDADVQAELTAQIDAGVLPAPQVDAGGHPASAYAVFFRNGQRICSGTVCSLASPGFCAYHSTFRLHGTGPMVAYSVHPDLAGFEGRGCGPGTAYELTTAALTHEVVEMITDPAIGLVTLAAPPLAWDDIVHSGRGEAADICTDDYAALTLDGTTFQVQQRWSNAAGACLTIGPVLPPEPGVDPVPPPTPQAPDDAAALTTDGGVARLVDTRDGAPVTPERPLRIEPGVADAAAVVLDVVATDATSGGYVTVWPCDEPRPLASNLDLRPGRTVANLVTAAVRPGAGVCLHVSAGAAHLVVDRTAAYRSIVGAAAAGRLVPVTPVRALDTRLDDRPFAAGEERTLDLAAAGVPAGASAVVLTVTAPAAPADGWWAVWPSGPWPGTSSLNATTGTDTANQAVVPVDGATVRLRSQAGGHVVVDVAGWFTGPADPVGTSGLFHPVTPVRALDTRPGPPVADLAVDLGAVVPPTASAVALTVTVTEPAAAGFATVFPAATAPPLASTLNFAAGETVPGHAVVGTTAGRVGVHANLPAHVVVDVAGWYA